MEKKENSFKKKKKSFCDQIIRSIDMIRAIFIRIVFGIHALTAICLVCYTKDESWYLVNSVGVVFIAIEW